jgi:UDP-N-acetylmuramoyl-tripeptide--D-alanyl-D-alanine ligase
MGTITLQQAAQWCGGLVEPKYADVTFHGANNDTRKLCPGQLFIALEGARDGHDFIPSAMEAGAAAVLCSRSVGDYPAIIVEDPRKALGDIARAERQRIGMKVVGVTGSVGKSTTKEMIAAVLSGTYRVSKTPANHNNDIGMPMALLDMPEDTQVAVLEMGMNHLREIAYLASIAQPDVAVITNIGTMHIEHLGSQEGILQAKLEILEGMRPGSKVLLNGDDALLWNMDRREDMKVTYFGIHNSESDYRALDILEQPGSLSFRAEGNGMQLPVDMDLEGYHYIIDAMAAVGVGMELQVAVEDIARRLREFRNMEGRQEIFQAKGCTIIKDCYNAGPESMTAALAVLGKKPGRRVAVLGDMLELGVRSPAEHYRLGRVAAEQADLLLAFGPFSAHTVRGAITGGMPTQLAKGFEDRDAMVQIMKHIIKPGDVLLVKGSRGMRMELILDRFLQDET